MKNLLYILLIFLFVNLSAFASSAYWVEIESLDNRKIKIDTSTFYFEGDNIYFETISKETPQSYYLQKLVINTKKKQAGVISSNKMVKGNGTDKPTQEKIFKNVQMVDIKYGTLQDAIYEYLVNNTKGDIRRVPRNQRLAYLTDIQSSFLKQWKPKIKDGYWYDPIKIEFTIDRNGNIIKHEVKSGDNPILVKSIENAIKKVKKFPPLPPYTDAKALTTFEITFIYDVNSKMRNQVLDSNYDGKPFVTVVKHKSEKIYKNRYKSRRIY